MSKMQRNLRRANLAGPFGRALGLYRLHTALTAADLREEVLRLGPRVIAHETPYYCSVDGYDKDPRELWQVPEVIALCRRIVESGLLSLMELNVTERNPMLWGAWDVYACANELIRSHALGGVADPSHEHRKAFFDCLAQSNATCDAVLRGTS